MPVITPYKRQQTITGEAPSVQMNPSALAGPGQAIAGAGAAMGGLADVLQKQHEKIVKQESDNYLINEGTNLNKKFLDFRTQIEKDPQYISGNYEGMTKALTDFSKSQMDTYSGTISDKPELLTKIKGHVATLENSLMGHFATLASSRIKTTGETVRKNDLESSMQIAMTGDYALGITNFQKTLEAQKANGLLSPESYDMELKVGRSKIAESHIEQLSASNSKGAMAVFNAFNAEKVLLSDTAERLKPKLEKLVAYEDGISTAEMIFNKNVPKTMNESINVEAMRKELIASGIKGDAKEVAEKRIEERSRELKADRAEKVGGYIDNLWQRIDDKGLNETTALKSIDTADLPGDTRVQLKKQVESHFKPPTDPEARFLQYMGEMEKLAELQEKINNGELRVQSTKDGLRYAGDIGRGNVAKLVSYGKNYEKALASPAMAPGQFDLVVEELRQSGVKDIPKAKSPEYKAMQATLLDELVTKQTATGKILDDVGVKNEFRRIITTRVPVNTATTLFGKRLWGGVDEKRQWEIENPGAVDITGLLRTSLKREPTRAEIASAKAAYEKKSSRREAKTRAPFGGN